jgi:signal transduction histidine kinase
MAQRAKSITAARLDDRLPVDHPHDELGRLAVVFNETLERLEQSFEQMQRFTGDVSHELRTPLTAMRTVGEVALRESRSPDAYRTTIGSMLEEVDRLTSLVERLLTLSRAGSGPSHLQTERVDLGDLAEEIAAYLGVLAEENGQSITVQRAPSVVCDVDRLVLRQAVVNLVDNAIKYSPADSEIAMRTFVSDGDAVLEVRDSGAGIAPDRGALIFDRHYRGHAGGRGTGRRGPPRPSRLAARPRRRQRFSHHPAARDGGCHTRSMTVVRAFNCLFRGFVFSWLVSIVA